METNEANTVTVAEIKLSGWTRGAKGRQGYVWPGIRKSREASQLRCHHERWEMFSGR